MYDRLGSFVLGVTRPRYLEVCWPNYDNQISGIKVPAAVLSTNAFAVGYAAVDSPAILFLL